MSVTKKIVIPYMLIALAIFFVAAIKPGNVDYTAKWLILQQCMVKVNGSTNVNKFTCTVAGYTNGDTLTCLVKKSNHGAVILNGDMQLSVAGFDCVNKLMTKDLRKTLKEKEYPNFYIHFISMERYPLFTTEQETIAAIVNIELAGVKKQLEIHFHVSMDNQGIIQLAGTQNINFSDFNLVAPRKLGGMIKTSDKLEVGFIIYCRIVK